MRGLAKLIFTERFIGSQKRAAEEWPLVAQSGHALKDRPQPIANFGSFCKQSERGSYRHRYLSSGTEIAKPFSVIEMKQ